MTGAHQPSIRGRDCRPRLRCSEHGPIRLSELAAHQTFRGHVLILEHGHQGMPNLTAPWPSGRVRLHAARGRSLEAVALYDSAAKRALRDRELGYNEVLPTAQHGKENSAQAMGDGAGFGPS